MAEHLIDRAAFGDHPLGRPVLGPEEHLRTFTREAIVAFRSRQWAGSGGGAFMVGNLYDLPEDSELAEAFGRFPSISSNGGCEPAPAFTPQTLVEERDSNQSHLRMSYRPTIDPRDPAARAALNVYSTLLGGSMGSRLFDEIREQRGLAYSVYAVDHSFADVPILQLSAGLDSGKCVEAYTRMREIVDELRADGPREEEFERAQAYAAGRRVLAFENTNAVARHAATQTVVFGQSIDPDEAIAVARPDDVRRGRRGGPRHLRGGVRGVRRTARNRRVHQTSRSIPPTAVVLLRGGETPDFLPARRRHRADFLRVGWALRRKRRRSRPKSRCGCSCSASTTSMAISRPTRPGASAARKHRRDGVFAGGAEYLATHVRLLSRRRKHTLVVAAGDTVGGSPLLSSLFHDEPAIEAMNKIGLDIAAVGNHEFDEGANELRRLQNGGCHPVDGCADGTPFRGAKFPFLAANVISRRTGKTIFPPYVIRKVGGERIGFIGMTLEGTPEYISPVIAANLRFLDEAKTANRYVRQLRRAGVRAIVVLLHEGDFNSRRGTVDLVPGGLRAARGHRAPHVAGRRPLPHGPHARRIRLRDRPPARDERRLVRPADHAHRP